ncbi:MAG: hypothetical protein ACK4OJ_00545 [Brevundimonas sp.]
MRRPDAVSCRLCRKGVSGGEWNRCGAVTQAWVAQIFEIIKNGAFNYTAVYDDPTAITQDNDYTYVLPSINLNYRITEDLRLRLGAAKAWARPLVGPSRLQTPKACPGASSRRSDHSGS